MIYQPDYILTVDGQEIKFLFVSFTFKRFCERKRIELEDLFKMLDKTFSKEQKAEHEGVRDIKTEDFVDILLVANEAWCVYNKVPFTVDVPQVYAWIDSMGGWIKSAVDRNKIMLLFTAKLLNIDPGVLVVEEQAEKNVVTPALNDSPGENSTSEQP